MRGVAVAGKIRQAVVTIDGETRSRVEIEPAEPLQSKLAEDCLDDQLSNFAKRRMSLAIDRNLVSLHQQEIRPAFTNPVQPPFSEILLRIVEDGKLITAGALIDHLSVDPAYMRWLDRKIIYLLLTTHAKPNHRYAINLSGASLESLLIAEYLEELLKKKSIDPSCLWFEVTEQVLAQETIAENALRKIVALGCRVGLDDLGAKHSSFDYLRRFKDVISFIKIDGVFVRSIAEPFNETVVEALMMIGDRLNLDVIAESVEDAEILKQLMTLWRFRYPRCRLYMQGWGVQREQVM